MAETIMMQVGRVDTATLRDVVWWSWVLTFKWSQCGFTFLKFYISLQEEEIYKLAP